MMDPPTFFRRVVNIECLLMLYFNITSVAGDAQLFISSIAISLSSSRVKQCAFLARGKRLKRL
ncbi:hypothetical protein EHJ13_00090 [Cronobacter dublinensis]|uniref:Uncharacterized protein n=1 Tax=Cronobacter dublinensis TaxID=413497 RepID=A0A9Q4XIH8_9ENTR|nr:hypothetical protein [Cronobacter dublinensis]